MSSFVKEMKQKLFYHERLLSMISDNNLPIKEVLLKDVREMRDVLEKAKYEQKYNDTNPSNNK